ncbi:MAG: TonB-dependent receptor [Bacteroidia bacterium]|nr:MAG: TonB-dependent receptor [Bacteroidia bacterium]
MNTLKTITHKKTPPHKYATIQNNLWHLLSIIFKIIINSKLKTINSPKIKLSLLLILLYSSSHSQTIGRIIEIKNKQDTTFLSDVMIYSTQTKQLVYSDSTGFFLLNTLPPNDTLDINALGYVRQKFIVKNPSEKLLIILKPAIQLNEIEVVYQRPSVEYSVINPLQIQTLNENYLQKAACCNLSESFETNASIDVQITDAITGIRQLQMNGLVGKYILLTKENMPYLFGIQSAQGLSFLPGPFIQSIQLSKGTGPVLNGYESFAGQINTELWHPAKPEFKLYFNNYINQNGRNEYNLIYNQKISNNVHYNLLLHSSFNPLAQDFNHDGFVDIPTGKQFNIVHKYAIKTNNGLDWQFGGQLILDERTSGQIIPNYNYIENPYIVTSTTKRYDAFSKSGWIFKNKPGHSIGLQLMYSYFENKNRYDNDPYNALQSSFYVNLIYQGIIQTTAHTYKIGLTYNSIQPDELYRYFIFKRNEQISGMFAEYNYVPSPNLSLLIGNRLDYHNYYGWIYIPRLHLKLNFNNQNTTLKFSAGKAFRTPNPLSENIGLMASRRVFYFDGFDTSLPYKLNPETGWTFGSNLYHTFKLFYRPANILLEYYYTYFTSALITDIDTPKEVHFYNNSASSHSAQLEAQFQPIKRLETHFAFRYVQQQALYSRKYDEQPYIPKFRGFLNLVYTTANKKWNFDFTAQYISQKRLPHTFQNPPDFRRPNFSQPFWNLLSQITYTHKWKKNEIKCYLGVENLNDFKQNNPIVAASTPSSPYFDASMIWAPIYGRMIYAGLRYYWR